MLGLYASALAKSLGASAVIALGRNEKRLRVSRRFGVDEAIKTDDEKESATLKHLLDLTGGSGADLVIEAADNRTITSG